MNNKEEWRSLDGTYQVSQEGDIISLKLNKMVETKKPNSSKFRNVSYNKKTKKWRAQITVKSTKICLGDYTNELWAAKVADAARVMYGKQQVNFDYPLPSVITKDNYYIRPKQA